MQSTQTSISDHGDYRNLCRDASVKNDVFSRFRSEAAYNNILEHVSIEQGHSYLVSTFHNSPHLLQFFDKFKINDKFGGPKVHDFGPVVGSISPTTLRYIKVLSDLCFSFGDLSGLKIIEIGGGYGGQCAIISQLYQHASYTIIDLPEPLALQKRFLDSVGIKNVNFLPCEQVQYPIQSDLVISNYALSELSKSLTDTYIKNCIYSTPRGYLTCNFIDPTCYSKQEFMERLPWAVAVPEYPLTHPDNYILTWKNPACIFKADPLRLPPQILKAS
jgi:hypothetical protein